VGIFTHKITLVSSDGSLQDDIEAYVDTGATFSSVPSQILERLGVQPMLNIPIRLANQETIERPLGFVLARIGGKELITPCTFGRPGDPSLIGAVTLEIFMFAVDPIGHQLVSVEALQL